MHSAAKHDKVIKYLALVNLSIDDFNFKNISKSYSKLIVNDKHLSVRVVKRTDFNTLNFTYLSNYIEEEMNEVQIIFSILDDNFTYRIKNEGIILSKDGEKYTLQIIHNITYWDIHGRLPKYMKKLRTL